LRDSLLGAGAVGFGGALVLSMIGDLLELIHAAGDASPLGSSVASGFAVGSDLLLIGALTVASVALLAGPAWREKRLAQAAMLASGSFAFDAIANAISAGVDSDLGYPGTEVASDIISAIASVVAAAAIFVAARAFLAAASTPPEDQAERDGRLGWASGGLAANFLLSMVSGILTAIFFSDIGATTSLTDGAGVAVAGDAIAVPGAAVAAVAFFFSRHNQRQRVLDWFVRRDRLLGIGLGILAFGLLMAAIAGMMAAGAFPENGITGAPATAAWLSSVALLIAAGAVSVAAVGFLRSRPPVPRPT
jgi:hypothetical protein